MITTKQALLIAAAAVVAHPFLTNAVDNWGKYPSMRAADLACEKWANKRGDVEEQKTPRGYWITPRKLSIRTCRPRPDEGVVEGFEMKGVEDGQVFLDKDSPSWELAGKYWRF